MDQKEGATGFLVHQQCGVMSLEYMRSESIDRNMLSNDNKEVQDKSITKIKKASYTQTPLVCIKSHNEKVFFETSLCLVRVAGR